MAVITVPSQYVLQVAEECGQKGVQAIVCISAGFKEVGARGEEAQDELIRIVNRYNMRLLGPNCMGVSNNNRSVRLNATILHDIPLDGNIAFVSQSGGLCAVLLDYAEHLGIGFSSIVSLGNQADITVNDILPLLAKDPQTEVIMLYLEQIPDFQRFAGISARISKNKPIVLLKAGWTDAGAAAAGSHTGSLAGDDQIADALIRKCGIIRVNSIHQAYYVTAALSRMPRMKGNRVAVLTNGGGPGILASDALSHHGFEIPEFSSSVQEQLAAQLMPEASFRNPIDLVAPAPPDHYAGALRTVVESGECDAVVILSIPPATIDTGEVAGRIAEEIEQMKDSIKDIPILACFFGPGLGLPGRKAFTAAGLPVVEYPEQLGEVLDAMRTSEVTYSTADTPPYEPDGEVRGAVKAILDGTRPGAFLDSTGAGQILAAYGLRLAPSVFIKAGFEEGRIPDAAEKAGIVFPAVAKIDHPDVIHKSDEGGVILNILGPDALVKTCKALQNRFEGARGVLVQQQLDTDIEVIVGAVKDPSVGHAVMIGLGGVTVELLKDVAFAHVPFSEAEARRAIHSLKSLPLLTGFRGSRPVDIDDLVEQMMRLNRLLIDFPELSEIDLNPLLFSYKTSRFYCADYRMRIEEL
jgi:acetyltransferase